MAHKWLTDKHGIVYHNAQSDVLLRSYMYIVFSQVMKNTCLT